MYQLSDTCVHFEMLEENEYFKTVGFFEVCVCELDWAKTAGKL